MFNWQKSGPRAQRDDRNWSPGSGAKRTLLQVACCLMLPAAGIAQDPVLSDPTRETPSIRDTMAKIKEVEKLDSYITENTALKEQNNSLQAQLADLTKQVQALTSQLAEQRDQLQKQLLQMPTFSVKSKVIGAGTELAVLETGGRMIRIRNKTELSVPVSDGVWVLMRVENISKDQIELSFPEMARTIILYD